MPRLSALTLIGALCCHVGETRSTRELCQSGQVFELMAEGGRFELPCALRRGGFQVRCTPGTIDRHRVSEGTLYGFEVYPWLALFSLAVNVTETRYAGPVGKTPPGPA